MCACQYPWALKTCFDEADTLAAGLASLRKNKRSLKDTPITIISRDPKLPLRPFISKKDQENARKDLERLHKEQLQEFEDARFAIAEGSGHLVQIDNPDLVVSEIKAMIERFSQKA